MSKENSFFSARNVALLGILLALVVVLQSLASVVPLFVTLNLALIPIILAGMLLGAWAGAFVGFACGVIVLIQVVMGLNAFYVLIWTNSPIVTTLICLVKTTVAGGVAGAIFSLLKKKNKYVGVFLASGIVPVLNTVLFILGCLCMSDTMRLMAGDAANILLFIVVDVVTINFFLEFATSLIAAPALHTVYTVAQRRIQK
ncbi:MAG: hypothetical protein IKC91_03615 [Clostridia bacterium]|nr:hypothetical protein [Clostridia bacterium]